MKNLLLLAIGGLLAMGFLFFPEKSIHKAARSGDLHSINRFLEKGGDINKHSPKNFISGFTMKETPLHHAAIGNQAEAATLLLDSGADPNAQNTFQMTPLHYAVAYGHMETISILLEKGASPNAAGKYGRSPLQFLLLENYPNYLRKPLLSRTLPLQIKMMALLLSKGADLEFRDKYGATSFLIATKLQSLELLMFLSEKGADPLAFDKSGDNALFYLLRSTDHAKSNDDNASKIFQFLVKNGVDTKHKNRKRQSLLHYACHANILDRLLGNGLDVNALDSSNTTPLHSLLVSLYCLKPAAAVNKLIQSGANPNIPDVKGVSPLHRTLVGKLHLKLVPLLLENGANVLAKSDKYGDTPLHLAARNRYATGVLDLLIRSGAKINSQNNHGCTPLFKSLFADNQKENFEFLVQKGANLNITEENGVAPLHLVAGNGKFFERWGSLLLDSQANISLADSTSRTPLDWAQESNVQSAVKALTALNAPKGLNLKSEKIQYKDMKCQYY